MTKTQFLKDVYNIPTLCKNITLPTDTSQDRLFIKRFVLHSKVSLSRHCGLKVSRSQAKIYENFANYFLKTKANKKCVIVLNCTCKGLQKGISELER